MRFVDTNVLIYSISAGSGDSAKRSIAQSLIESPDLAVSGQVLQEFYAQATRSTRAYPLSHDRAATLVHSFARFEFQPITFQLVDLALKIKSRYDISYWDAAIVAAASMLGCTELLTEDVSHGQRYDGVLVVNPFR